MKNKDLLKINDVIAYQCHVKGITFDESSNVNSKGTFLGLIEKLDSIKELGVNQLILLPVYDFDENLNFVYGAPSEFYKENNASVKNYWGFSEGNYFKLKPSYYNKSEDEFTELVNEIHSRNMEIVLMFYFEENMNTELMLNVLKYWYEHFSIDGFFMNVNPYYLKMISDSSALSDAKLYVYDYDPHLNYTNNERIAVYDYNFRNVLRKTLRGDEAALSDYVNYLKQTKQVRHIVSITSHNGFTLYDLYAYSRKHNELNGEFNTDGDSLNFGDNCGIEGDSENIVINKTRLKMMKNALVMLLLSNGIPMILGGDEEANSQKGNNNAYCQDNEISWVQYDHPFSNELRKLILDIITIRKNTFTFYGSEEITKNRFNSRSIPEFSVYCDTKWGGTIDENCKSCGFMYTKDESYLYMAVNFDNYKQKMSIPHLPKDYKWSIIARTDENYDLSDSGYIVLDFGMIVILEGKKN